MKTYEYADPSGVYRLTEDQIIAQYFDWWLDCINRSGKNVEVSRQNCIDDFCVVHWAYEVMPESRLKKA